SRVTGVQTCALPILRLERELELVRRTGLHVDLLGHPLETLYRHRHGIGTRRHGLRVASGCIGDDDPCLLRRLIRNDDDGSCECAAGCVTYDAGDLSVD